MTDKPKAYFEDIHRLRGVTILLVVLSHGLQVTGGTRAGEAVWHATQGQTWPFVFIAGFLFAHLHRQYDYTRYVESKLRNVIAPYVVVVSAILAMGVALQPGELLGLYYLTGHLAATPLWFVPMIAMFYLAFPIYDWLARKPRLLLGVALVAMAASLFAGRPQWNGPVFDAFLFYQSAYLAGMAWRVWHEQGEPMLRAAAPLLIVLVVAVAAYDPSERYQLFFVAPLTFLMLLVMKAETRLDGLWNWLAVRSFGIFFLHGIFTDYMVNHWGREVPLAIALAACLFVAFLCGAIVSLVQQVAGTRSRYLVGA